MTRYFISDGMTDFDVYVADDADLDGTFDAICAEDGERVRINGWQAETIEKIDDAQLAEA
ncbi:hypothetical protein M9978_08280 [Sphingomonas sp. MG17]|uniref:Uncharacterized protein n=1 Tax=Sphingomonas tagetis TaxID=2949092 RepID=A0A9X2HJU7_9SPHN|nr:hypothetical protein [Sphingomonas tagetis]MCP3730424.1 hypothetical protein [Sphingomonas tagetis]